MIPAILACASLSYSSTFARALLAPVFFLCFMIPLPNAIANQMSGGLQWIATGVSTFILQTIGVPAFATGNIISLSTGQIGVAEACSGLRMLYSFFALTVGACMLVDRSHVEKVVIALLAIPIAIAVNCLRIVTTGLAYEYGDPKLAETVFHDIAGWLMMPAGFGFLLLGLAVLDRILIVDEKSQLGRA